MDTNDGSDGTLTVIDSTRKMKEKWDARFKILMQDVRILVPILKGYIPELGDLYSQQITDLLPMEGDGKHVKLSQSEYVDSSGIVRMDVVIHVSGGHGVEPFILHMESEFSFRSHLLIMKRGLYYQSRLTNSQKGSGFMNDDYSSLKPVDSLWFLSRVAERDAGSGYRLRTSVVQFEGRPLPASVSEGKVLSDIGVICVAPPREGDPVADRLVGTLLYSDRALEENKGWLQKFLNMDERDGLLMSEIESIRDILGGRDAEIYDSAFEEGKSEGISEERSRKDAQFVSKFADALMDYLRNNDVSPEEAVETMVIIEEYRGPVLEEVMRRLAKKE